MNTPGGIYLDGGGDGRQPIDKAFAAAARRLGAKTVLYLPHAMPPERWPACVDWFTSAYGDVFADITTVDDPAQVVTAGAQFDAIFLGGGNTGRLLDTLHTTGLDELIERHVKRGGLLCGGSAGAVVCGRTILTVPTEELSATSNDGLDLLGGVSILPHYEGTAQAHAQVTRLAAEIAATVWAIPENCGVQMNHDSVPTTFGTLPCLRFSKNGEVTAITYDEP